jgi:C_GCAxxG_C_C family probable redox protein
MTSADTAASRFEHGYSCSQAVFSTFAERLGMDNETAVKVASGFGGGMGRMAGTCGAVTGAFMVLGLKHGGPDGKSKERTYELVRRFAERFRERHGTLECRDLLGCDIGTPEGQQAFKEQKLHATVCTGLVRDAAEIVEEIL